MNQMLRIAVLFFFFACAVLTSSGAKLTQQQLSKLHPFFRVLVGQGSSHLLKAEQAQKQAGTTPRTYGAIIYTHNAADVRAAGVHVNSVLPEFVTAQISASDVERLASLESVRFIGRGSINYPQLEVSIPEIGASLLHAGFINNTAYQGSGAIVLIYDTGIDWKHFDFRKSDTTQSRILYIWDQTLTPISGEQSPSGLNYGVEYTQAQINGELNGTARGVVREMDTFGHGTHVTGIAAGNGQTYHEKHVGVAPEADIIVVKGGDDSFTSSNMIDGLTYASAKASALGKPIVVNWSIGGQYGPHDGTLDYEVAVDNFVQTPGRVVCIAAGNNGATNIHVSGTIAPSSPATVSVYVAPYIRNNSDHFYLDLWLRDSSATVATVTSPAGEIYVAPSDYDGYASSDSNGIIYVWNYPYYGNHNREIEVDVFDTAASNPSPTAGTWTIQLSKTSGSTSNFDGWLFEAELGNVLALLLNGDAQKIITSPGTSKGAITAASYVTKSDWPAIDGETHYYPTPPTNALPTTGAISFFSSIGPTADGRIKPDIAAPGEAIGSVLSSGVNTTGKGSFILQGNNYWIARGTSMATPHITGSTALLLGSNPSLTAAQIKTIFMSTANADAFATGLPNVTWGSGKLDVLRALATTINSGASVIRTTIAYDTGDGNSNNQIISPFLTGTIKYAVHFSPAVNGTLTGIQVNLTPVENSSITGSGNLVCEVYTNNSGVPGRKIGTSVNQPFIILTPGINNYIQMTGAGITVTSGTDFFIVLSVSNSTDVLKLQADNSTSGTHSLIYNGSSWSAKTYNTRIHSIVTSTSGLPGVQQLPLVYCLNQNYPNPFNSSTNIKYSIPARGMVKLKIFDILGRSIATLVNTTEEAGVYYATWDAKAAASGVYFYRLESGSFSKTERMLLLK